jgi:hypothetical protein
VRQLRLKAVQDHLFSWIHKGARTRVLDEFLKCNGKIHIVAGAVRDAIAAHEVGYDDGSPRDLDIAISNIKRELFDEILSDQGKRNRHGGYVLNDMRLPSWDIWRLEDTVGLRKTRAVCSLENMLRSFNLSCNAIALDIGTGVFFDFGAIDTIRSKKLGFVQNAIRHSHGTFAAKALLVHLRFAYRIDVAAERFIGRHLRCRTLIHESQKVFPELALVNSASQS